MPKSNMTCGLSNLPIKHGDDIAFFVLEKTDEKNVETNGFSYATEYHRPVGIPIYGEANGYGGIENIKSNGRWMFELLTNDQQFKYELNGHANIERISTEELLNYVIALGATNHSAVILRKDILEKLKVRDDLNFSKYVPEFTEFTQAYHTRTRKWLNEDGELTDLFADSAIQKTLSNQNLFVATAIGHEFPTLKPFMATACMATHESIQDGIIDVLYVTELLSNLRKRWTPQMVKTKQI